MYDMMMFRDPVSVQLRSCSYRDAVVQVLYVCYDAG